MCGNVTVVRAVPAEDVKYFARPCVRHCYCCPCILTRLWFVWRQLMWILTTDSAAMLLPVLSRQKMSSSSLMARLAVSVLSLARWRVRQVAGWGSIPTAADDTSISRLVIIARPPASPPRPVVVQSVVSSPATFFFLNLPGTCGAFNQRNVYPYSEANRTSATSLTKTGTEIPGGRRDR